MPEVLSPNVRANHRCTLSLPPTRLLPSTSLSVLPKKSPTCPRTAAQYTLLRLRSSNDMDYHALFNLLYFFVIYGMDRVQSISQILSVSSRIHLPDGYLIRSLVCHSSPSLRSFYSYKYTNTLVCQTCLLRYQRQVIWPCVCDHSLRSLYFSLVHFTLRVLLTSKQSFALTNAPVVFSYESFLVC